jgi:hypothetical protein
MANLQNLVPIKVAILVGSDGKHLYPNFNSLDAGVRAGGKDWSQFFDSHGLGWHYDKLSGLGEKDSGDDPASIHLNDDTSIWYGMNCVPEDFALAAVAKFPDTVSILTEAEWEAFYDTRAHVHEETEILDLDVLQKLKARLDLEAMDGAPTTDPTAEILALRAQILDPENSKRGIRKNPKRKWADYKLTKGLTIKTNPGS